MSAENRVSQSQIDYLLEYMVEHPQLAKGVGLGARSKETVDRQWELLASILNALGSGSSKSGSRWKKYWADIKHKAKSRAASRRRDLTATGGGPPNPNSYLTETDQKVLAIIGKEAVFGDVQHRIPLFSSQTETQTAPATHTAPGTYIAPDTHTATNTHTATETYTDETYYMGSAVVEAYEETLVENITQPENIICSPSTNGQTTTRAGETENPMTRLGPIRSPARRLLSQTCSPLSRLRRSRIASNKSGQKFDKGYVVELENRRVEAEEKLAKAAILMAQASLIQAEAARSQVEAARIQAEANKIQAESMANLINLLIKKT